MYVEWQVITMPYSIGYVPLEQVMTRNLAAASMVNKYGKVVVANPSSIAFAARDKGAIMDPVLNFAVLADSSSAVAWPITGLTYFVLRTAHHIGDCPRRQAAIAFLYNFYNSPSVTLAANSVGFDALPPYMIDQQIGLLKNKVRFYACADFPFIWSLFSNNCSRSSIYLLIDISGDV